MAHGSTQNRLVPLGELDGYRVAEGNPDVRGWEIHGADDRHIGEVRELIVDVDAKKARYLVVAIGRAFFSFGKRPEVLVPIARARLDEGHRRVYLDGVTLEVLAAFPAYEHDRFAQDQDRGIFGQAPPPPHSDADHDRFFGRGADEDFLAREASRPAPVGQVVEQVVVTRTIIQEPEPIDTEGAGVDTPPVKEKEPV